MARTGGAWMTSTGRLADLFYETETEYYGLPPFGLLDEIGEGIVSELLKMFEHCPKALSSIEFLSQGQIESGCEAWSGAVEQSISRTFELFETYSLKNVLLLPEAFNLPHRPIELVSDDENTNMEEEIAFLVNEIQEEKIRQHEMKVQQDRIAYDEAVLAKLEDQLGALNQILSAHSITNLSSTISTLNDQIDSLKAIVADTLEVSSNAFALDDGELPRKDYAMDIDPADLPMDTNVMSRLLDLEIKSCASIGALADIKALLKQ